VELLDRSGADSLAALDRLLTRQVEAHDVALAALERQLRALASAAEARRTASAAAADAGFADVDAARAAMRSAGQVEQLAALVREHEQARARAEQELLDPDVAAAATRPAPDLDALGEAVHTAALATAEAREEASLLAGRTERLGRLRSELDTALAAWAPVRQGHVVATRVAAMVDGTSPDNELRMRLSAYVLAHRLAQVVDAANLRLSTMSDRRYSLEHSGRRGAGETRGGLSLLVRDDWSGERRDPATLSGGETFVVSLALALGLADVITQEAGGADLDTLFVDEGFGSLDADTLDDVMDTLDALRDGGRVVGVVSHVAEMRDRIPTQLLVDKQRTGSTLRTRLG
jgi:exonuclease SbcC